MSINVEDWTYEELIKAIDEKPTSKVDAGVVKKLILGHEDLMVKKYGLKSLNSEK